MIDHVWPYVEVVLPIATIVVLAVALRWLARYLEEE